MLAFGGTAYQAIESYITGLLKRANILYQVFWKGLEKMSEEKGNLRGLAISFILISLIMSAGVGIVYFIGQSIY